MGAMLEMMQRMMGQGQQPGEGEGKKPGDENNGGQAENGGDSDAANSGVGGATDGNKEERRVPKSSGTAGSNLPDEFQKALDAYNAGAKDQNSK